MPYATNHADNNPASSARDLDRYRVPVRMRKGSKARFQVTCFTWLEFIIVSSVLSTTRVSAISRVVQVSKQKYMPETPRRSR